MFFFLRSFSPKLVISLSITDWLGWQHSAALCVCAWPHRDSGWADVAQGLRECQNETGSDATAPVCSVWTCQIEPAVDQLAQRHSRHTLIGESYILSLVSHTYSHWWVIHTLIGESFILSLVSHSYSHWWVIHTFIGESTSKGSRCYWSATHSYSLSAVVKY